MSILTAATTIYCGLLFLTDDMGEEMKIILFIAIVLSNAVFFFSWIFGIVEAYAVKVTATNPKLAKWLCFCFVKNARFQRLATKVGVQIPVFDPEMMSPTTMENSMIITS